MRPIGKFFSKLHIFQGGCREERGEGGGEVFVMNGITNGRHFKIAPVLSLFRKAERDIIVLRGHKPRQLAYRLVPFTLPPGKFIRSPGKIITVTTAITTLLFCDSVYKRKNFYHSGWELDYPVESSECMIFFSSCNVFLRSSAILFYIIAIQIFFYV